MNRANEHGIIEYKGEYDDTIVYFDDWIKNVSEYRNPWESIFHDMIVEGHSEDDVDELREQLEDEFYDYCDEYDYRGEIC